MQGEDLLAEQVKAKIKLRDKEKKIENLGQQIHEMEDQKAELVRAREKDLQKLKLKVTELEQAYSKEKALHDELQAKVEELKKQEKEQRKANETIETQEKQIELMREQVSPVFCIIHVSHEPSG
jgi:myosin heavy subunit